MGKIGYKYAQQSTSDAYANHSSVRRMTFTQYKKENNKNKTHSHNFWRHPLSSGPLMLVLSFLLLLLRQRNLQSGTKATAPACQYKLIYKGHVYLNWTCWMLTIPSNIFTTQTPSLYLLLCGTGKGNPLLQSICRENHGPLEVFVKCCRQFGGYNICNVSRLIRQFITSPKLKASKLLKK